MLHFVRLNVHSQLYAFLEDDNDGDQSNLITCTSKLTIDLDEGDLVVHDCVGDACKF